MNEIGCNGLRIGVFGELDDSLSLTRNPLEIILTIFLVNLSLILSFFVGPKKEQRRKNNNITPNPTSKWAAFLTQTWPRLFVYHAFRAKTQTTSIEIHKQQQQLYRVESRSINMSKNKQLICCYCNNFNLPTKKCMGCGAVAYCSSNWLPNCSLGETTQEGLL